MTEKTITVNLQSKSLLRKVYAVQADSGRTLRCVISDCTLPAGLTARIYAKKPDDTEVYNAGTIDGNAVVVPLTTQMLASIGSVKCQIELSKDTEKVTTFYFEIVVEKSLVSDSAIESSNEYTALEKLVTSSEQAITDCEKATTNAKTATTNANNAASSANSAATAANTAASKANTATSAANTAASTANASATKADTATTNADTATAAANTAADKATKVAEGDVSSTKVTFTQSTSGSTLNSGETLATLFGKIERRFTTISDLSLISASSVVTSDTVAFDRNGTQSRMTLSVLGQKLLQDFSWGKLSTTAKTIIGAINELFTAKGSTDISDIGDGTLTGAVSELNTNLNTNMTLDQIRNSIRPASDDRKTNLLAIDLSNRFSDINRTRTYYAPSSNSPISNSDFMGLWECIWIDSKHVGVRLTEMFPQRGRVWTNFYNYSAWEGWVSTTPS